MYPEKQQDTLNETKDSKAIGSEQIKILWFLYKHLPSEEDQNEFERLIHVALDQAILWKERKEAVLVNSITLFGLEPAQKRELHFTLCQATDEITLKTGS